MEPTTLAWSIVAALSVFLIFLIKSLLETKRALSKYQPLVNLDQEIARKKATAETTRNQLQEAEQALGKVTSELRIFNEDHDLLASGFYRPKYAFQDSKKYAEKLEEIRSRQKLLIKEREAIVCDTEWSVAGSKAEGKKMTDRIIKLGLSAFNVQCDNEILSVRFDNIDRSETKMGKIRENINRLLEPNDCRITEEFFKLKLEELFLAYEYEEQVHKEKDEQRLIRDQIREEEKARQEAERAQSEAEREEKRYEDALVKARKEIEKKSDVEREAYATKIMELESLLREAHLKKERAKSLAEQTRRGYVYIISNIGSFGENIYKIGMTRRLDPMARISELGDASVPFEFDVHALIQTDDAPALERKLHETFTNRRVNRVNMRKEFFSVRLEEIAAACKRSHGQEFRLTLLAEAKQYRQSIAMTANQEMKAA